MIQINLTLFVQMINIIITYKVLSAYLLAPIIERLLERKKEEKQLRDEITLKQKDVENFLTEKTSQLAQFQRDAKTDYPFNPVRSLPQTLYVEDEAQEALTDEEYASLKKNLTKRLYDVEHE